MICCRLVYSFWYMSLLDWNSIENSRHGIAVSIKVSSENFPLLLSEFGWLFNYLFFLKNIYLFYCGGLNSEVHLIDSIIPCLEFSIEFQSNNLIYHKEYTKRQQIIYVLIKHLHDEEGFGYRKISKWLNQSGIKTHRGKNWFNSSVISVLKENINMTLGLII